MSSRPDPRLALAEADREAFAAQVGRCSRGSTDGRGLRIGLAAGLFNGGITARLLRGALAGFSACGVDRADVELAWAPGAFELPLVARAFARRGADAVVCLGAVVRGDTGHYDFVAGECARGLQRVQLDTGVPVVFGVLTTNTVDQALERSAGPVTGAAGSAGPVADWTGNKGWEAAVTGVEMARLLRTSPLSVKVG